LQKNPKEIASQVKNVITMLPSSPQVQEVLSSTENGFFSAIQEETLIIDTSTIDPNVARELSKKAKNQYKSEMVDAPVSGGVVGAENATLTFMVGGEKESFDKAKPILECMGKNVVYCGGNGNGQVAKICNNLALAIEMIGISEAMNLGITLGMDPKILAGIFNTSTSRCWSSDTYNPVPGVMPGVPSSRGYTGGFGVDLMAKDLGLAINSAHQLKVPLPLGGQALQLYNLISTYGNGGKDFSYIFEFLSKKVKQSS
jgi:3-hydroxyisobutyrate dehydrogenase